MLTFTGDKITGRQKIATDVGRLRNICKVLIEAAHEKFHKDTDNFLVTA
jgi:hypothetical protein